MTELAFLREVRRALIRLKPRMLYSRGLVGYTENVGYTVSAIGAFRVHTASRHAKHRVETWQLQAKAQEWSFWFENVPPRDAELMVIAVNDGYRAGSNTPEDQEARLDFVFRWLERAIATAAYHERMTK